MPIEPPRHVKPKDTHQNNFLDNVVNKVNRGGDHLVNDIKKDLGYNNTKPREVHGTGNKYEKHKTKKPAYKPYSNEPNMNMGGGHGRTGNQYGGNKYGNQGGYGKDSHGNLVSKDSHGNLVSTDSHGN
jgi:hypothetical protein